MQFEQQVVEQQGYYLHFLESDVETDITIGILYFE